MVNRSKPIMDSLEKERIVVVDDRMDVRDLVSEFVRELGYEAFPAKNGGELLSYIEKEKPDLIICDYRLKGKEEGLDLLALTRSKYPELPFVMMSGYPSESLVEKALNLGADRFIRKPFSLDELEQMLSPLVDRVRKFKDKKKTERKFIRENYRLRRKISYFSEFDRFARLMDRKRTIQSLIEDAIPMLRETFEAIFVTIFLIDGDEAVMYVQEDNLRYSDLLTSMKILFQKDMIARKKILSEIHTSSICSDNSGLGKKIENITGTMIFPLISFSGVKGAILMAWTGKKPMGDDAYMILRWMAGKLSDRVEMIIRLGFDEISLKDKAGILAATR